MRPKANKPNLGGKPTLWEFFQTKIWAGKIPLELDLQLLRLDWELLKYSFKVDSYRRMNDMVEAHHKATLKYVASLRNT